MVNATLQSPAPPLAPVEAYALWSVARAESNLAYDGWRRLPGAVSYAVYRAAEDRADAAQSALELAIQAGV